LIFDLILTIYLVVYFITLLVIIPIFVILERYGERIKQFLDRNLTNIIKCFCVLGLLPLIPLVMFLSWAVVPYVIGYFLTFIILAIIDTQKDYNDSRRQQIRRRQNYPRQSQKKLQRCRICGGEIHRIPEIDEKTLLINGVEIKVTKYPICCRCYEEYKKWWKYFEGGG